MNWFLKRSEKKATQPKAYWRSKKQEKDLSKRLNGRTITGSGMARTGAHRSNMRREGSRKGDVAVPGIARIEAKTTQAKSFSVTLEMIEKLKNAGLASDELPMLVVEFLDQQGKPIEELAVVPLKLWQGVFDAIFAKPEGK